MKRDLSKTVVVVILAAVVILFTLFGLVIKQDCDIDAIYLWCRLHPMSTFDIIGLILFYGGALVMSGVLPIQLWNGENNTRWNWVMFVIIATGLVLIWNL
jgi:hypothetical protein